MNNVCPLDLILPKSFTYKPSYVKELIKKRFPSSYKSQKSNNLDKFITIDAIEIHSGMKEKEFSKRSRSSYNHNKYEKEKDEEVTFKSQKSFESLWKDLEDIIPELKAVAISFPFLEDKCRTIEFLSHRRDTMLRTSSNNFQVSSYSPSQPQIQRENNLKTIPKNIIWQTDGRPMSGDIGKGSTQQCVKFGSYILKEALPTLKLREGQAPQKQESLSTEEFIQLAGGTNGYTMKKLHENKLSFTSCELDSDQTSQKKASNVKEEGWKIQKGHNAYINGIAFGGYARKLLEPYFDLFQFESRFSKDDLTNISSCAYEIYEITSRAKELVDQVKGL